MVKAPAKESAAAPDMIREGGSSRPKPAPVPGVVPEPHSTATLAGGLPDVATVWTWLGEVPDPEIPVISLVDLGIIRDVAFENETLVVTVTPTYSGCPATSIINLDIETALRGKGIEKLELKRQLSPAWTTDWISDAGRAKLEAYGIAPPQPAGGPAHCPHCKSAQVERVSQFGSTPCKAQWRCLSCREPFDYFKCI